MVLAQHHERVAVIAVAHAKIGQQVEDPPAVGVGVGRFAQQDVDLCLLDERLPGVVVVDAGGQRHRTLEEVLHVVGRDLHRQPRVLLLASAQRRHDLGS